MGRPKKDPADLKHHHVRVPVTEAQRLLIEEAAKLANEDIAAWSRSLLVGAAKRQIERSRKSARNRAQ